MTTVTVLGAGAWGIGLALTAARAGREVTIWSPFPEEIEGIKKTRENTRVLPGIHVPKEIKLTSDIVEAAQGNIILSVTPAQTFRSVLKQLKPHISDESYLVSCAKGIEMASNSFLTQVVQEELPSFTPCVLAGPNFARDVAMNLPAGAVIAHEQIEQSQWLASSLTHENFKVYPLTDVNGVEISSALKNVLAIGCGLITGADLGENARALYLTFGIQELIEFGQLLNSELETFLSPAGLGDIVLTCMSLTSRNMKYGYDFAKAQASKTPLAKDGPLAEGVMSVNTLLALKEKHDVPLRTCTFVYDVLHNNQNIHKAFKNLMG